jgi:type I restriction enzyme S subunit
MKSKRSSYQLADVINLIGGGTPKTSVPEYWDGNIPWISVKDFNNDDRYVYSTEKSITQAGLDNSSAKMLAHDDIIISARGTVGELAMIPFPMAFNQSCYGIRGKKGIIVQSYLYYLLRDSIRILKSQTHGSVFDTITRDTFANIEARLPSIEEQQTIVDTLTSLDDQIAANRVINHHLEQMAQAIFKSWFVDFEPFGGEMPDGWREGTFNEVISATIGGDWGKDTPTGNNTQEAYCIRGADIPDVNTGSKGKIPIRYILPKNYDIKHLAVGDIVVEISGGSPTQSTGRCALITQSLLDRYDRRMVCTNFCRAIKPLSGYSPFVYFYWKYLYVQNVMFAYENGTTGIKNLDISGFYETEPIIIPPVEVAHQFTGAVGTLIDTVVANGLENETLATTRDSLLPRLMSGEISIADVGSK